jgi:DNA-binding transcriptional LysR family regulator
MELRHLRYFVAVAETENVSRAALKLHISQPALSRQIRDLEEELGFSLLERGAKSVRLTEAGRVFLSESRAVLVRVEEAVKAARTVATGTDGELHIGYAPTLTVRILPPGLRAFQAASPNLRVRLHDLATGEMLVALREGKLQLAFSVRPANGALRGLDFEELTREPLRLAVSPAHAFARRRSVNVTEAARERFVAYNRRASHRGGVRWRLQPGIRRFRRQRSGRGASFDELHDGAGPGEVGLALPRTSPLDHRSHQIQRRPCSDCGPISRVHQASGSPPC